MHAPLTEVILSHHATELARATLPPGEYVIGRETGVDLRADTPLLSRRHARLTINYDHCLLEDLASSNGTFVNERALAASEAVRLFPNQPVRLGPDLTLEVRRQHTPSEPGVSLPPAQAAIARHLPAELLAEKRYAIGGVVAQGGMGAILHARQSAMQRTVAMKVMLDTADEASVLRFIGEAQITGQLDHPNIVPIHELGVDEQGQVFYTMKMVRGITLKAVLADLAAGDAEVVKKYPLPVLLNVFQKVCDALAFAHAKGVIHRDLKPENLMLGDFGSVLVMDWGLAKVLGQADAVAADPTRSAVISARAAEPEFGSTMAGSIMGTPAYMSPEQARGEIETLDARSDIYALGAILFEILHLRPAYTGTDAMDIVRKVARGEVEWVARALPDSLLAVVRQALAFDAYARYPSVEALQADLLAYQNGFATSAEKAGAWKQFALLIKRHKATSIGIAAVLLVGSVLGGKAVMEGRKAQREGARASAEARRANQALADLKKTAPALRRLAETEAGTQRFESALANLDAAIALDPAELTAYWRRAWLLLGMEDFSAAAAALRTAQAKDPARKEGPGILAVVEQLAETPESQRWTPERAQAIYAHLQKVGATGEVSALSAKMRLGTEEKVKLIRARLDQRIGKGTVQVVVTGAGWVELSGFPATLNSLEPLRGLPIVGLDIDQTQVVDLEPLRGMELNWIRIARSKVASLEPLRGMNLDRIDTYACRNITDWSPLRGMPLRRFEAGSCQVQNLSFLAGAPLEDIYVADCGLSDISSLRGAPLRTAVLRNNSISDLSALSESSLEELDCWGLPISDLSPLRGKLLKSLILWGTKVSDLSPLKGAPISKLDVRGSPIANFRPLLDLPALEKLDVSGDQRGLEVLRQHPSLRWIAVDGLASPPYQPVAEFWPKYDAQVAAEKAASEQKLKSLLATASGKKLPDGTIALDISKQNIRDLRALAGANLSRLNAMNNPCGDLAPLRNMPLTELSLYMTPAADLSALQGMPLRSLSISNTWVSDLSPLRGLPLEKLHCEATPIKDLRPLLDLPKLRNVLIPRTAENIEVLRAVKTLEYIGWEGDWAGENDRSRLTAAEFWARYDAQPAAGKK